MPCHRHRTRHLIPLQYTDTGPTCSCTNHWCRTSYWNTQLPILMSRVRPDREILPRPSTYTSERSTDSGMVVVSRKLGRKYCTNQLYNPGPVVCESITLSARPELLPSCFFSTLKNTNSLIMSSNYSLFWARYQYRYSRHLLVYFQLYFWSC